MSYFSHALQNLVTKYGGNTALQRASGVHNSVVSRLTAGDNEASPETLQKLCENIPDKDAASLVWAWLSDLVPGPLRRLVHIVPTNRRIATPTDPGLPELFSRLDRKVQSALRQLAEEAIRNPDFGKYLRTHTEYIFPEWAEREFVSEQMELGKILVSQRRSIPDEDDEREALVERLASKDLQPRLGAVVGLGSMPEGLNVVEGKAKSKRKPRPRGPRKSK